MRFEGRVSIVTGSTRGIGRAIVDRLVAEGSAVVVSARKAHEVDDVVAALRHAGGRAVGVVANMVDDDAPSRLVAAAVDSFGAIDHVVNNVGISPYYGPLREADRESFLRTVAVNTWAPIAVVQAAVSAGLGRGSNASVVNVTTIGSRQVQPLIAPYIASKAALDVAMKVLARELGPAGVRINGVAPGLIRTDMAQALWEGDKEGVEAAILPLQRIGLPDDVASAALFLLSADSTWITGTVVDVDGGRLLVGDEPHELIGRYPGLS